MKSTRKFSYIFTLFVLLSGSFLTKNTHSKTNDNADIELLGTCVQKLITVKINKTAEDFLTKYSTESNSCRERELAKGLTDIVKGVAPIFAWFVIKKTVNDLKHQRNITAEIEAINIKLNNDKTITKNKRISLTKELNNLTNELKNFETNRKKIKDDFHTAIKNNKSLQRP